MRFFEDACLILNEHIFIIAKVRDESRVEAIRCGKDFDSSFFDKKISTLRMEIENNQQMNRIADGEFGDIDLERIGFLDFRDLVYKKFLKIVNQNPAGYLASLASDLENSQDDIARALAEKERIKRAQFLKLCKDEEADIRAAKFAAWEKNNQPLRSDLIISCPVSRKAQEVMRRARFCGFVLEPFDGQADEGNRVYTKEKEAINK